MAKFYGSLDGGGKAVTRCGRGYIESHIRGWNHGIRINVKAHYRLVIGPRGGKSWVDDGVVVQIDVTGGSCDPGSRSTITIDDATMKSLSDGSAKLDVVPVMDDYYSSAGPDGIERLMDPLIDRNFLLGCFSDPEDPES